MTPPPQLREQIVHGCHRPQAALATRRFVRASTLVRFIFGCPAGLSITAFTTLLSEASTGIEMGVTLAIRFVGIVDAVVVANKSARRRALKISFWTDTDSPVVVVVVVVAVVGIVYVTSFSDSSLTLITSECGSTSFCTDLRSIGVSNWFSLKYLDFVSFHGIFLRWYNNEGRYFDIDWERSLASKICERKWRFFFIDRRSCSHLLWYWKICKKKYNLSIRCWRIFGISINLNTCIYVV